MLESIVSQELKPRFRFLKDLDGAYISLAVWPGRSDPGDEVLSVTLRETNGQSRTLGRLAVYRARDGTYTPLPDLEPLP